ncbi:hypothetical protein CPB97_008397 [Podila verticillata]|nr:hypothetical protein CPB97_008397 [Podila verticillata]
MSITATLLDSPLFQQVISFAIWLAIILIPLLIFTTVFFCAVKGTGNAAGFLVDFTAKQIRGYQQKQRKKEKLDPADVF